MLLRRITYNLNGKTTLTLTLTPALHIAIWGDLPCGFKRKILSKGNRNGKDGLLISVRN